LPAFARLVATFILLTDSKLFTALANLLYAFGIMLMLATFVLGKTSTVQKAGSRWVVDLTCSPQSCVKYLRRWRWLNSYQGRKQISAN
jgi:hypothetical protein